MDVVVQRMEAPSRRPLGCGPQSPLQLSHFVARLTAAGVVRSAPGGHSLALTCSSDATTPGTLPSRGVVRRRHRRYYDPLGLPLRTPPISPSAYTGAPCPDAAAQTGLSCSAPLLAHVLRPIPRRDHPQRSGLPRGGCCLRRDMSGSAPGLCHLSRLQASLHVAARVLAPRCTALAA